MKLKILHLEDSVLKHSSISRVLNGAVAAEIDWVTDVASGLEKIDEAIHCGKPYDLAITDMHYPLLPGTKADWEAGDFFTAAVTQRYKELPVIICSTHNMQNPDAYGCVWFNEINDWESELTSLVKHVNENKV